MRVMGFIGPSGSGKSHRASWVAKEKGLDFIIDDGLLIKDNQVIAGTSAKKENTKIGSIRRALFVYSNHVDEVRKAINLYKPDGILILGTSEGMVETIAKKLSLPKITQNVYIHDVANEFEIRQALSIRKEQGKHVIPVPTFEIKKDFSGYMLDPLQIFRRKGKGSYQLVGEKSVVRPTFSYLGSYTISDYTLFQIIEYVVAHMDGINKISRFRAESYPDGISIELDLILVYGFKINSLLEDVQRKAKNEIERLTALNIKTLNVSARSLVVAPSKRQQPL